MLTDQELNEVVAARARNKARLLNDRYPRDKSMPAKPRDDSKEPKHYVALTVHNIRELLDVGAITVKRFCWHKRQQYMDVCPWGAPGDLRFVHEPVIVHPNPGLGVIYSDNPNWPEHRRAHPIEERMPIAARRFVVRIETASRERNTWLIELRIVRGFPIPPVTKLCAVAMMTDAQGVCDYTQIASVNARNEL